MESTKLVLAFREELSLTEQGMLELKEKKKGLTLDVKTDSGFKEARKERTERNKLLKSIDSLAIDGKKAVDEAREQLKKEVTSAYHSIVSQFETEDADRKKKAEEEAEKEAKRVAGIKSSIESIRDYARQAKGKSVEDISAYIESIDLIDPSENFGEFTQEALQTIKEVLAELNLELNMAQQNKKLAEDREKLRKEQAEQAEVTRIANLKQKAQERLNNLTMIPSEMLGKSSKAINAKVKALEAFEVSEEEFLEFTQDAISRVDQVVTQLTNMAKVQEMQEQAEQKEIDEKAAQEKLNKTVCDENRKEEEAAKREQAEVTRRATGYSNHGGNGSLKPRPDLQVFDDPKPEEPIEQENTTGYLDSDNEVLMRFFKWVQNTIDDDQLKEGLGLAIEIYIEG